MARVRLTLTVDRRNLESTVGEGLKKDITSRTAHVRARARQLAPRGKTGNLKRALKYEVTGTRLHWVGRVYVDESMVNYGLFVEAGTGVFGPNRRVIRPRTANNLIFRNNRGRWIRTPTVKGQRPKGFLRRSISAARG